MTRWERLLQALGITDIEFALQHQSRFDMSPKAWLQEQCAQAGIGVGTEINVATENCDADCCRNA